jgi:hemolysin activation/secretion protein
MKNKPCESKIKRAFLLALVTHLYSTGSFAQITGPAVPGARIEQEIRPAPEPVQRGVIIDTPRFPEQIPSGAEAVKFTLSGVTLNGNSAVSTQDLSPTWNDKVGKVISLADAFAIAARISARYREEGYLLSQSIMPQQNLATEGATLNIEIVEGYIDQATFIGAKAIGDQLQPYIDAIVRERPLRLQTLERNLLLMNELAGLSVRANLRPANKSGASAMELSLAQDKEAFSLSIHNRSSKALGSVRAEAGADFRGVFGSFDRHTLRYITSLSNRLNYLGYAGEQPIGYNGLKLTWSASSSKSDPRVDLPYNIDSRSTNVAVGATYPIIRSRNTNVDVRASIGGSNNSSDAAFETRDHLRMIRAGVTWDSLDRLGGLNIADLEFSKGFSKLGASSRGDERLSRLGLADPQFFKSTLYLARLQSITGPWTVLVAATGQHSKDVLATSETFGLGGDLFLRAYDPSELIGDSGYAGKVEVRYDVPASLFRSTVYLYQDAGKVRFNTPNDASRSILSTGIGIRFNASKGIRGYLEIAKPHHKIPDSTGSYRTRIFGGVGIDF